MLNRRIKITRHPSVRAAAVETLEPRRLLSAAGADPIAFPLNVSAGATPAAGTLADGTTSPQSAVFTPAQIRSIYGINNIKLNGVSGTGAGQTIAIVTAYDDPDLVSSTASNFSSSDLHVFDQEFGIADPPAFTKIEQTIDGANPTPDTAWAEEASLDVEWAHAVAPAASIDLVEANTAAASELLNYGVKTAADLPGVSVVSMSFGFSEFAGETSYDSDFTTPAGHTGVTFVSSTGDSGVPGTYPAFSPNVLAVGGTHLIAPNGTYSSESVYSSSGGGISSYEPKPSYQSSVTQSASQRTIPDVSIDGDPNTGVDVYDSYNGGYAGRWYQIAGTSFSSPAWAGLIAIANQGRAGVGLSPLIGKTQTLPAIYSASTSDFHDVTSGSNGYSAGPGYDLASGRGTPIANLLVPAIAGVSSSGSGGGSGGSNGTASIAGEVYVDSNANGKLDSGEAGLSGVELYIDLKQTGSLTGGDPTYTTGSGGTYSFTGLAAGVWQIREILPSGYKLTNPSVGFFDITVQNGWHITGENFGNQKTTTTPTVVCSVSGYVYTDTNGDKKMDDGETGLAGVTLFIDTNGDGKLDDGETSVVTNSAGYYSFSFSTPGVYKVVEVVPSGKHLTNPTVGYYDITLEKNWYVTGENWGNLA
jgi:hypothetical protein